MKRRTFLAAASSHPVAASLASAGLLGGLSVPSSASTGDYKALVVVFLNGGNDGHNTLIPTDSAYQDYARARNDLALSKAELAVLPGSTAGHTFGLHPALSPMVDLYNKRRLAFIANVGALIEPSTAQQVVDRTVKVPPFLLSHSDQQAMAQGWGGDLDASGWAGRGLELMPSSLRNELAAVTFDNNRTLVLGKNSRVAFMSGDAPRFWGRADLSQPASFWSQSLNNMAQWQFSNAYEAEYARTFGGALADSTLLTRAFMKASQPQVNFESNDLATRLRTLASVMPVFKTEGYRRQVFQLNWGGFDTHANQRGSGPQTQDAQLATLAKALVAFDAANLASGLGVEVTTLVMSEFGRTLRPASGAGTDHAWGGNWMAMGGVVAGGQVLGQIPSLVLSGVDDSDIRGGGRFVPSTSLDQVGASLMQWLGMPASSLLDVFPNLKNFPQKTINLITT